MGSVSIPVHAVHAAASVAHCLNRLCTFKPLVHGQDEEEASQDINSLVMAPSQWEGLV